MKQFLIFVGLIIYCNITYSQKLKYKDIYPLILAENYPEVVPHLKNFLLSEPDHPSANLQLAIIYEKRYKGYHPLLDFESTIRNVDLAKKYYLKARLLVDEKEIRKNGNKFYTNVVTGENTEPNYPRIRQKIDSAIFEIDRFINYAPEIYNNYIKSISFHNLAMEDYRQVNENYYNLNELYLFFNEDLNKTLIQLKSNYDSCIYYFDVYLQSSDNYPMPDTPQSYVLKLIQLYRIDGLVPLTDFHTQKIIFWNYGHWVDQVLHVVNKEIIPLRNTLESIIEKLRVDYNRQTKSNNLNFSDNILIDMIQDLFPNLKKYDPDSIVIPLIYYLWYKKNLLFQIKWEEDKKIRISNNVFIENQLIYYNQLMTELYVCDSLINSVNKLNLVLEKNKYEQFIEKYFEGKDGFTNYIIDEKKFIEKMKAAYAEKIRDSFQYIIQGDNDSVKFIEFKKQQIPLYVNVPDSINMINTDLYTSQIFYTPDSSVYVGGLTRPKSRNNGIKFFLGRVERNAEVVWFKIEEFSEEMFESIVDSDNTKPEKKIFDIIHGEMEMTPLGLGLVLSARDRISGKLYNIFKLIDEEGEELKSANIKVETVIRILKYHEKTDSFILSFQGDDLNIDTRQPEEIQILMIDNLSKEIWRKKMIISGNVTDIVDYNEGYLIFGNCSAIKIQDEPDQILTSVDQEVLPFVYSLNNEGEYAGFHVYSFDHPIFIGRVLKITDDGIHLFGSTTEFPHRIGKFIDRQFFEAHFITNVDKDVLYANFQFTD